MPGSVHVPALRVLADGSGPGLGLGELLPHARQPDVLADQHDGGHEHGKQSARLCLLYIAAPAERECAWKGREKMAQNFTVLVAPWIRRVDLSLC